MQPTIFLVVIAGSFLLAIGIDFISKTPWAKTHRVWKNLLSLALVAAAFGLGCHFGRAFDSFYATLFGMAMGFKLTGALTERATRRAQVKEWQDRIETALIDQVGAESVNVYIDASACPRGVLDERIATLVKSGYTVSTTTKHNDKSVALTITGKAIPATVVDKPRRFSLRRKS